MSELPPLDKDAVTAALVRVRKAADEHPAAMGLRHPAEFIDALGALHGRPTRVNGIPSEALADISEVLASSYGSPRARTRRHLQGLPGTCR